MTTETKTYNGWTNYETWCVNLWLDNEPFTSNMLLELACENSPLYDRSQTLKEQVMENAYDAFDTLGTSMFTDLLGAALEMVDSIDFLANDAFGVQSKPDQFPFRKTLRQMRAPAAHKIEYHSILGKHLAEVLPYS